jgi:hypothetical protein
VNPRRAPAFQGLDVVGHRGLVCLLPIQQQAPGTRDREFDI